MRVRVYVFAAALAAAGCAGGTVDDGSGADEQVVTALSSSLLYQLVTPTPDGATGPLALRRANAVPTTLNPEYGLPTLPEIHLAADATTTQAALDDVLAIPFAGHGSEAVALFATRDAGFGTNAPAVDVVEIYAPNQEVALADVSQRDALYQILPASGGKLTVRLVNEKDYPAGTPAFDYAASADPAAAAQAVQAGAFFTGSVDVKCTKFLFWTTCKPPTAVHVAAYFSAR
jgi:hypothetical protein